MHSTRLAGAMTPQSNLFASGLPQTLLRRQLDSSRTFHPHGMIANAARRCICEVGLFSCASCYKTCNWNPDLHSISNMLLLI